ncbi:heat shock factor protein-like isoform X5 [Daphnia carinata]|uniref:heat shock factor protein-like isoform X5 n=1 Tax=Daphnia carinata TaxID=120202 RepID=UPI0025800B3A|nr:heat shock factor protein-like isoform X5 [Daphnia carinata]
MHTVGDATSSVPAFLGKLWKLVEDPSTNHLISWNANGMSFTIRDQARFARELLPLYYKHNNMASFVRQLNMYGFHKVVSVDSGGLKLDKDEMEFAHMYFLQGQEFLLEHIKRKIPISKQEETKHTKPEVLSRVLADVRGMKGKQENVDSRLNTMKRENEALWREVASLRQKHMKQQQIVNKLIQFLISIVQPNGRAGLGLKRRYPLMLGEGVRSTTNSSTTEKGMQKETGEKQNDGRLKDLDESAVSGNPNMSDIPSPKGPIIHDVTDIDESSCADLIGNCNDLDADQMEEIAEVVPNEKSPEIFFPMAQISELPISVESTEQEDEVPAEEEEAVEDGLGVENPDFNTMVQMEAGTSNSGSGILENSAMASPMSPDLLMAVDPREVNSGALLSFEENRKEKGGRGKSVVKNQERTVASTESTAMEREELDSHLDTMQVDLEQLREVLSLQGSPLDASTLLGLFSADDTLPGNGYLSMDMDMFKNPSQGAILGNEVIAYNDASFFDMVDEYSDEQMANDRTTRDVEDESIVKDTTDLFDLLDDPPQPAAAIPATTVSAAKKKKRN